MTIIFGIIIILVILGALISLGSFLFETETGNIIIVGILVLFSLYCLFDNIYCVEYFYHFFRNNGEINGFGYALFLFIFLPSIIFFLYFLDEFEDTIFGKIYLAILVFSLIVWVIPKSFFNFIWEPAEEETTILSDKYFETCLIRKKIDDKLDGSISSSKIYGVEELNLYDFETSGEIENLTGIENFKNLKTLEIKSDLIKVLDLSANNMLEKLIIKANNLKELKLPSKLKYLKCNSTAIEELDLSHNHLLSYLDVENNNLVSLKLSNDSLKSHLSYLNCSENNIIKLDLLNQRFLDELECKNNQLIELKFCNKLNNLDCINNKLSKIDLSGNLKYVMCSGNKLVSLKTGESLYKMDCSDNVIRNIDIDKSINLNVLNISQNQASELSLINNTNLEELNISNNRIENIDLTPVLNIKEVTCNRKTKIIFDPDINKYLKPIRTYNLSNLMDEMWEEGTSKLDCSDFDFWSHRKHTLQFKLKGILLNKLKDPGCKKFFKGIDTRSKQWVKSFDVWWNRQRKECAWRGF